MLTDHLGSPRTIVDQTGAPQWQWTGYEAFGNQAPNELLGSARFVYDGRFAGQRFDESTSSLHNGFRTYNIKLGRYMQSDPLGLEAGWNTYAYVGNSPVEWMDPWGLRWVNFQVWIPGVSSPAGHVQITEENGDLILSAYPEKVANGSKSKSFYGNLVQYRKKGTPDTSYSVWIEDNDKFDQAIKELKEKLFWSATPYASNETNCVDSAVAALRAGGYKNASGRDASVGHGLYGLFQSPGALNNFLKRNVDGWNIIQTKIQSKIYKTSGSF